MIHTVSAIREFRTCQRKYRHKYRDLVRPALEGKARLFGTAAHDGFDAHWLKEDRGPDFSNPFWSTDKGTEEKARCEAVVKAYRQHWDDRSEWGAIVVEHVFEFRLGGFTLRGKLDKLAFRGAELCLVEHKATSDDIATLGDDYWQRLPLDLQIAIYQEAVQDEYGQRPAILYDVIKKPALKLKKTETVDEFRGRCLAVMIEAPDDYLVRRIIHRTRDQQAELLAEAVETMRQIEAERVYARNDQACVSPYGACAFLGVCTGSEQLDSPRFVTIAAAHPELGEQIKEECHHGSSGLSVDCPV